MTERDNDPFFRQLELVAGVDVPLSWDSRKLIPAYASQYKFAAVSALIYHDANRAVPYLAELFGLPDSATYGEVYEELRKARAKVMGLPVDTAEDVVLSAELKNDRSILTMSRLRKERDLRLDTHVPLVNTPEW